MILAVGVVLPLLPVPLAGAYAGTSAEGRSILLALAQVAKYGNGYAYQVGMIAVCFAGLAPSLRP